MTNKLTHAHISNNSINFASDNVVIDKMILRCKWNNRDRIPHKNISEELSASVKLLDGKYDLILGEFFLRRKSFLEVAKTLGVFINTFMRKKDQVYLKSIEYAIDLPIDFTENHALLRLFTGLLEQGPFEVKKSIAIEDTKSLKITSFSFKTKMRLWINHPMVPVKFQIYNKSLDISRISNIPLNKYVPITRFEFTILNSHEDFSYKALIDLKELYLRFFNAISTESIDKHEQTVALTLFQNFVIEKNKHKKLSVILFIIKNHEYFVTKEILEIFYSYLLENDYVKSTFRSFYYKFKRTQEFSNIKFSSLQEISILLRKVKEQLN